MTIRLFHIAIFCSFFVHAAFYFLFSQTEFKSLKKPLKQLEVTYRSIKSPPPKERAKPIVKVKRIKKSNPVDDIDILSRERDVSSALRNEMKKVSKFGRRLSFNKKQIPQIPTKDMGRRISVPTVKIEKIANPDYLSYNNNIRRRIKQQAYNYIKNPDFQAGEVYLTFILSSTGSLKKIKIIEAKTSANFYLRDIGLRSIEGASPFPPFPVNLNYPELTFNVVISFEVQ